MATTTDVFKHNVDANLQKAQTEIVNKMAKGQMSDFPEYRFNAGVFQGLSLASDIVFQVYKAMEADPDGDGLGKMPEAPPAGKRNQNGGRQRK